MKDSRKHVNTSFLTIMVLVISLLVLAGATYAWFTSNRTVYTDRVTSKTDSKDVRLLLSRYGGAAFAGSDVVDIKPLAGDANEALMPVSTADLKTFVFLRAGDATTSKFGVAQDESYYYHETIYIKAEAEGMDPNSRLALYLNNTDPLVKADNYSLLLNAARLGLVFNDSDPMIFYLSEDSNTDHGGERINNTFIDGVRAAEGNVVVPEGNSFRVVPDPATALSEIAIGSGDVSAVEPIAYLEFGEVYKLDIYFYIEGTDPDCSDSIQKNGAELWLDFYGAVADK